MNHPATKELKTVGPYTIFTKNPIKEDEGQMFPPATYPRLSRFRCSIGAKVLTAKCIERDFIGTAGKRKSHKKWNTQVKTVTQISSLDSPHILATCEVVKTNACYWLFQDYDASQIMTLADFVHSRAAGPKLTTRQMRSIIGQMVEVFCQMSSHGKFVHGNLDSRQVFVHESQESGEVQAFVDPSEHHMLTRLLKQTTEEQARADTHTTQEETGSEEFVPVATNAFLEFRKNKKVNTQSDIQSLGQLVLLLMKQTDLSVLKKKGTEQLSDLVQSCAFKFKKWEQVAEHPFVKEPGFEAATETSYVVLDETSQAATAEQDGNGGVDLMMQAPLKESLLIEGAAGIDGSTTEWQADEENKDNTSSICEDLEKLVQTGYYELIQTGMTDYNSDQEREETALVDESAFARGMVVFDNDDEDGDDLNVDGSSPLSYEDEDGYEVICARELINVPTSEPSSHDASKTMIGQGASYVIGQASRLIGNLWAKN